MKPEVGMRVRLFSRAVFGTVLRQAAPSQIDGSERWLIKWDTGHETSYAPDLLMPPDQAISDDPRYVLLGEYNNEKVWAIWAGSDGYRVERTPLAATAPTLAPPDLTMTPIDLRSGIWAITSK